MRVFLFSVENEDAILPWSDAVLPFLAHLGPPMWQAGADTLSTLAATEIGELA